MQRSKSVLKVQHLQGHWHGLSKHSVEVDFVFDSTSPLPFWGPEALRFYNASESPRSLVKAHIDESHPQISWF